MILSIHLDNLETIAVKSFLLLLNIFQYNADYIYNEVVEDSHMFLKLESMTT